MNESAVCGGSYSVNICSMGLDARIGTQMAYYKRLPLVTGSGAYVISTLVNLAQGIHTPCTEDLFSQGQFQLLAIARAVVLNPRILLLDEITANLDSRTEAMVLSALQAASRNRTVISVSHRLYAGAQKSQVRFLSL